MGSSIQSLNPKKLVSSLTEAIDKLCNMVNSGANLNVNRSILRLFTKVGCLYMFNLKTVVSR